MFEISPALNLAHHRTVKEQVLGYPVPMQCACGCVLHFAMNNLPILCRCGETYVLGVVVFRQLAPTALEAPDAQVE